MFDAHTHVSFAASEAYPHCNIETIRKEMKEAGIDKALVFPLVQGDYKDNEAFIDGIKEEFDIFIPLVFINPLFVSDQEIFDLLSIDLVKGVKINPRAGRYDCRYRSILKPLMECANALKKHVLIAYTSDDYYINMELIEELSDLYTDCTIQIGHMGSVYDCSRAIDLACRKENVYLDSCSASINALRRAVLNCPDKLLMGCDYPFGTYASEKLRISEACRLSEREEYFDDITNSNVFRMLRLERQTA